MSLDSKARVIALAAVAKAIGLELERGGVSGGRGIKNTAQEIGEREELALLEELQALGTLELASLVPPQDQDAGGGA